MRKIIQFLSVSIFIIVQFSCNSSSDKKEKVKEVQIPLEEIIDANKKEIFGLLNHLLLWLSNYTVLKKHCGVILPS